MKHIKTIALLLALVMTLAVFASCNDSGDGDPTDAPATDAPATDAPGNNATDDPNANTPATPTNQIVLFDGGAFLANVIRADEADDLAKRTYTALRAAIKSAVGKNPEVTTDFDKENADKPAILLGNTAFAESAEVYSKLKTGEATATTKVTRTFNVFDTMLTARPGSTVTVNVTRGTETLDIVIDLTGVTPEAW